MTNVRRFAAIVGVLALLSPSMLAQPKSKADKKAAEARAKPILAEAKTLAKQKKYLQAYDKYVEAQAIAITKDGTNGLAGVNAALSKEVEKLLKDSKKAFEANDTDKAMKALQDAQALRPKQAAIYLSMAVIELKTNRPEQALEHLDTAYNLTSDADERQKIMNLRTATATGRTMVAVTGPTKDKVEDLNKQMEDSANYEKVCAGLKELRSSLQDDPTTLLNLAKCAEEEGRTEEALELLAAAKKAAPKAIDTKDVRDSESRITALMGIEGETGTKVRAEYAAAAKNLRNGEYTRAIAAYGRAEELSPNFPDTQWRLASLHQALGNPDEATKRFERYLTLEKNPEKQAMAKADLEAMQMRQSQYEERTNEAQRLFDSLVDKAFVQSLDMDFAVSQRDMTAMSTKLQEATTLVPLGTRSNAMLGEAYLLGNNYEAAKRSFLAVRDKGAPVSFLTRYELKENGEQLGVAKVEITDSAITLVPTALWDKKAKGYVPTPDAGKVLETFTATSPASGIKDTKRFEFARVKKVETKNQTVQITLDKGELVLSPRYLVSMVPPNGALARKHANTYTKLFRDFTPITEVEIGPERMTGGEKFGLAMSIAAAAMGSYSMMASSALSAAQRVQFVMDMMQTATRQLQAAVIQQREMLQGTSFKLIPTDAPVPEFRVELLN